jgi:methyl-accepting chemotaxis protein
MRPGTLRSDKGQIGLALIIVIAWGLTAVVFLTRILVTAQDINGRVKTITSSLTDISGETALVAELNHTEKVAKDILAAADDISPMLGTVDETAKHIDATVPSILSSLQQINSTVVVIGGRVKDILGNAQNIDRTAKVINGQATTILNTVDPQGGGIQADTARIRVLVHYPVGITGNLCRIDQALGGPSSPQCG